MAELITGARGQAHITPKQDAVWHRGMIGTESCILDYGEKLAPTLVPSYPTDIRILDGCGMLQGRFFEIEKGTYDQVSIPAGAQGYNRIDIVCAKITQNENGTQTFSWEVVQGTQTTGTPTPPTVAEHSLDDGDEFALMPIASVELEGVNIVAVETVAEISSTIADILTDVADYIIERGTETTSDGTTWEYEKWLSGRITAHAEQSRGAFSGTLVNGWYARILSTPVPTIFTSISLMHVSAKWGTGYSWGSMRGRTADNMEFTVFQNSASAYSATIFLSVYGRWR